MVYFSATGDAAPLAEYAAENLEPSASGNPTWLESRRFPIGAEREEVTDWLHEILS